MSFDWFVDFEVKNQAEVDNCVKGKDGFDNIKNIYSQTKLLATCFNKQDSIKNYAKSGEKISDPKGHKFIICRNKYKALIGEEIIRLKSLKLYTPIVDISTLPKFSFFLQFTFKLATPYLSKDDEQFYPCENPIRKDKVFKLPMVSASTWKGNLRWTVRQINGLKPDTKEIIRLFGNEKGKEDELRSGRLNFYPTFFDKISLEVINPHDRKTKAGTQPIYIESVPESASGTFSLLYVPFDLMGRQESAVKEQIKKDMEIVSGALEKMMLTYGFSAKKGNGFGVVDRNISGSFEMSRCTVKKQIDKSNPFSKLLELAEPQNETEFSGFDGLTELMGRVKEVMERGHDI